MVKNSNLFQLFIICFCLNIFVLIECQQRECDKKIFNNNTKTFQDLIDDNIKNPAYIKIAESGKWATIKTPLTITRSFERYAVQAGYLRKDTIEREYVISAGENLQKRKQQIETEYKLSTERLEALLRCGTAFIRKEALTNKKYKNFDAYLDLINKSYNYIKNSTKSLRDKYNTERSFFVSEYVNSVLEKINELQIGLAQAIETFVFNSGIWREDIGKQSLEKVLPNYDVFFKNFGLLKKRFTRLTPKEILYYLFQIGILKAVGKSEEASIETFIEALQKFKFILEKSWFVSNKKNMLKDANEIINALQTLYPVYPKDGSVKFINKAQDFPEVFVVDISAVLWDMLRDLKENIRNIQKKLNS